MNGLPKKIKKWITKKENKEWITKKINKKNDLAYITLLPLAIIINMLKGHLNKL